MSALKHLQNLPVRDVSLFHTLIDVITPDDVPAILKHQLDQSLRFFAA
jgi:hypothetical protein